MKCNNCHGKGHKWSLLTQEYLLCMECHGSGITSCCEGNPNMSESERPMFECDAEVYTCPYCMKAVVVYVELDGSGIISRPEYDLVANWVYHSACWDKQMREHPPGEPNVK
jgi:hypothetical protein